MTTTSPARPAEPSLRPWRARTDAQLLADQLAALHLWNRRRSERAQPPQGQVSREMRLDLNRREEVLQREQAALRARVEEQQLNEAPTRRRPRALLVHRNAWFRDKVGSDLARADVEVVAALDNGADALGFSVAEQPDVALVEDALPMVSGLELVAALRDYCPSTILTAQVAHDDQVSAFLDAGVHAAWTRRTPPADIAAEIGRLVS